MDTHGPTTQEVAERPASVLFATHQDEEEIYDFLVRSLWKGNGNGWGFAYDPVTVLKQIEVGTRPDPTTRSDITDQRRGLIGIVRDDAGRIAASVGLFIMPPLWFSTMPGLTELWLHVAPGARTARQLHRDLFAFSRWAHDHMKGDLSDWNAPFPLSTGFMHNGARIGPMERLWRMMSGAKKAGVLFMRP